MLRDQCCLSGNTTSYNFQIILTMALGSLARWQSIDYILILATKECQPEFPKLGLCFRAGRIEDDMPRPFYVQSFVEYEESFRWNLGNWRVQRLNWSN